MKNLNKFKSKLIKLLDYFNDIFYPYLPPQLPTQQMIDKMPSLDVLEAGVYQDTLDRIDPDGLYHYCWHLQQIVEKGEGVPGTGDMCLHQGILLGAIAMRIKHIGEDGMIFKIFDALLRGMEHFIENGYLIRGRYNWRKIGDRWFYNATIYADDEGCPGVSGDQLAGFCFGLSLAYLLHPERFSDSLKQKILSFTDRMIDNKMMLQQRDGKTSNGDGSWIQQELAYDSWRMIENHATTKLALLSLTIRISDRNRDRELYWKLINDYSFDSLAEYSSIIFGSWNNDFGTNIAALSLFTIGINMNFPDYVKRGLKRIAYQTRDYGYGMFSLLDYWSIKGKAKFINGYIEQRLYSHFILCGEDKFARSIFFFGKKKRVSALSIRVRGKQDFVFQRDPFDPPNNFNPDMWALGTIGSEDFMIEYWLAKYLGVI